MGGPARSTERCAVSEMGDDFRAMREARQEMRASRLPGRQQEILILRTHGFRVRKVTDYQFRINERLDLYPTRRRFHHLASGRRGGYSSALAAARRLLGEPGITPSI